jgi:hypothetical protein
MSSQRGRLERIVDLEGHCCATRARARCALRSAGAHSSTTGARDDGTAPQPSDRVVLAEGLNDGDHAWTKALLFEGGGAHELLEGLVSASRELTGKLAVVEEVDSEHLWDRENPHRMRDGLEDFVVQRTCGLRGTRRTLRRGRRRRRSTARNRCEFRRCRQPLWRDVRSASRTGGCRAPARAPSGGTIAVANWTKEGFIGKMFKTFARFLAPPGMPSPVL